MELGKFSVTFDHVIEHNEAFFCSAALTVGLVITALFALVLRKDRTDCITIVFAAAVSASVSVLFVKNEWAQKNPPLVVIAALCAIGIYVARYYPYLLHKRTYAIR